MARGRGKYLTSNRFGFLSLAMDGQHQGFFITNRIPKKETSIILFEPILLFYLPRQFIRHIRGVEWPY